MKKQASKKPGAAQSAPAASETPKSAPKGKLQIVKGIKNTLFKAIPVGGSGIVAGVVRGLARESGNYGDYWQFKGDFAAAIEGDTFKAGTLYMPDVAADLLANAFASVRDAEQDRVDKLNDGKPEAEHVEPKPVSVEFKIRLRKNPDEKSNTGFVWAAEPVREVQPESDRVLALLASND